MFRLCRTAFSVLWAGPPSTPPYNILSNTINSQKRFRSGAAVFKKQRKKRQEQAASLKDSDDTFQKPHESNRPHEPPPRRPVFKRTLPPPLPLFLSETYLSPVIYLKKHGASWARLPMVINRFISFGLPEDEAQSLLQAFGHAAKVGDLGKDPELFQRYQLWRLEQRKPTSENGVRPADVALSDIFLLWVTDPANLNHLPHSVSHERIIHLKKLMDAAACHNPTEHFPPARHMKRRFIMHVGPTNSGKTYHALRALAAAETGCYAGPLRLLAYEVFERLNLGQIAPLGIEGPELQRGLAMNSQPATPNGRPGYAPWAQTCNMITGEEIKTVSDDAHLLACTVEMVNLRKQMDVAVIDEIQMIGDRNRGYAWTNAVLGLCAREVHLCGEDTAEPIVRELLKLTGEELEVRRYERLSPLVPMDTSLEGSWKNVQKGDCVVAFSRNQIFEIKEQIEEETGMRCAVVYGRLPPEIRSEQAALFNNPDSGYDVLVGSDAVGMGLNLKIRRIIFHTVRKYDGYREVLLSASQLKQIAGRAGRFGQQVDPTEKAGGSVTTLEQKDLSVLHDALKQPNTPVLAARLAPSSPALARVSHVLPKGTPLKSLFDVHMFASLAPPSFQFFEVDHLDRLTAAIEGPPSQRTKPLEDSDVQEEIDLSNSSLELTLDEKLLMTQAPVPWLDPTSASTIRSFVRQLQTNVQVSFERACEGTKLLKALNDVEAEMSQSEKAKSDPDRLLHYLQRLEGLHKMQVCYIWMGFRNPVAFPDLREVQLLKERTEAALQWVLENTTAQRKKSQWVALEHPKAERIQVLESDQSKSSKNLIKLGRAYKLQWKATPSHQRHHRWSFGDSTSKGAAQSDS